MANFHAIVNLPGLLTKMGVKYRRFSRIKKATCFYFGKIFICITRRQGADGYIHASLDIQTVKIRKRN
ncbi:hypothetical protein MJH54_31760, partial [Salmonella enterica subsp. enterica serovar Montevideo]|nr:hypothetical protein [Salmonella enterica subsp. enterica serovar Montevideo]